MRRRVALKIIKPGMDSREVIARFEQERQALALMDHPNIAKVFDAGATPHGRPYFVMELVRGVRITEYCDEVRLATAERLRLFIAVCHAVQHAHQKGIIHRDLKPSNILVTLHDGVPVPKVIDFGVAKATQQQRLTDLTVYTRFEQMVGTPLYMSPEQAEMSGLDIDTRSDIYSLGVLLYELLAGRTPFDPEALLERGLDEIRRVVREDEPLKPSTFLSTLAVDRRTVVAQHRQSDAAKLAGQIRGDLDWIVMKALEKDRNRRYETATGLARDLQRHLASEPVQARPPTAAYRFRRFAKRNKIAFAAGSAVLAALVIGLGVSTWMFFKEQAARERAVAAEEEQTRLRELAEAEEKKATAAASKSEQIAEFLREMLGGVRTSVALGRDTTLLREIVDKAATRIATDLEGQPDVKAQMQTTLGGVYRDIGQFGNAEALLRDALSLRRQFPGENPALLGNTLCHLGVTLNEQGKYADAVPVLREAAAIHDSVLDEEHEHWGHATQSLAVTLGHVGKYAESEQLLRGVIATRRRVLGNEAFDVAYPLNELAQCLTWQQRHSEAEALCREALAIYRNGETTEMLLVLEPLRGLAHVLLNQGRNDEAEPLCREALELSERLYEKEHDEVAHSELRLARCLGQQGETRSTGDRSEVLWGRSTNTCS